MNEWNKLSDILPEPDRPILCWDGEVYRVCKYMKVLTWKGRKYKIVNVMSSYGAWAENVTHWMYFPRPPKTEGEEGCQ